MKLANKKNKVKALRNEIEIYTQKIEIRKESIDQFYEQVGNFFKSNPRTKFYFLSDKAFEQMEQSLTAAIDRAYQSYPFKFESQESIKKLFEEHTKVLYYEFNSFLIEFTATIEKAKEERLQSLLKLKKTFHKECLAIGDKLLGVSQPSRSFSASQNSPTGKSRPPIEPVMSPRKGKRVRRRLSLAAISTHNRCLTIGSSEEAKEYYETALQRHNKAREDVSLATKLVGQTIESGIRNKLGLRRIVYKNSQVELCDKKRAQWVERIEAAEKDFMESFD